MNCSKCGTNIKDDCFFANNNESEIFCYDCANKKSRRLFDRKKTIVFIEKGQKDRWAICHHCHQLMQIDKEYHICNFCYLDLKKRGVDNVY